jgi:hypothetical protein
MKGLLTLIKLNTRALDELRRKMAALENQKLQLQQLSARLGEDLLNEIRLASKTPEMGQFFGDFSNRVRKRQESIAEEVAKIDRQIDMLNVEIRDAFSELKKYEIALENVTKRDKEAQERRLAAEMDDVARQQHSRKTENQA